MSALLEVDAVARYFGGILALSGCTLQVQSGTITGLIGPNGSGKTTLFNVITGLYRPDGGDIRLRGQSITGLRPSRVCHLGLSRTFQITRLFWDLTVLENMIVPIRQVSFGSLLGARTFQDEIDQAMQLLQRVGLEHLRDEPARKLSFGQQKLLEFAAILMSKPDFVLLDEPAGGVNPTMANFIMEMIRDLNGEGVTFLVIEHNMNFVMQLCDPIYVLDQGVVIADGPPESIQNNAAVLQVYLGEKVTDAY